jgi:hypothetical protein
MVLTASVPALPGTRAAAPPPIPPPIPPAPDDGIGLPDLPAGEPREAAAAAEPGTPATLPAAAAAEGNSEETAMFDAVLSRVLSESRAAAKAGSGRGSPAPDGSAEKRAAAGMVAGASTAPDAPSALAFPFSLENVRAALMGEDHVPGA